ncbi:MAG: hypothetical protein NW226_17220 [Microscillaceae bacterium]|nr:hypothetical protein [Microscillaceae bacterium]
MTDTNKNPFLNLKGVKMQIENTSSSENQSLDRHQKVLNYFQNLYLIAAVDKQLAKEETSFLVEVAQQMGITPREAAEIMMTRNERTLVVPESEEERLIQLEDIIVMMMVDKKIHEKEYQLCLAYTRAIGKDRVTLDRLILKIIKGE